MNLKLNILERSQNSDLLEVTIKLVLKSIYKLGKIHKNLR